MEGYGCAKTRYSRIGGGSETCCRDLFVDVSEQRFAERLIGALRKLYRVLEVRIVF
jgi:hypothetical protein